MAAFAVIGLFVVLMTISYAPEVLSRVTLTGYDYAAAVTVCTIVGLAVALPATQYAQMIISYTTMMVLTISWYIAFITSNRTA